MSLLGEHIIGYNFTHSSSNHLTNTFFVIRVFFSNNFQNIMCILSCLKWCINFKAIILNHSIEYKCTLIIVPYKHENFTTLTKYLHKCKQECKDGPLSLTWLPDKFWVTWHFGSREEVQYRFSRWWPFYQNDFSYFWSTSHFYTSNEAVFKPGISGPLPSKILGTYEKIWGQYN